MTQRSGKVIQYSGKQVANGRRGPATSKPMIPQKRNTGDSNADERGQAVDERHRERALSVDAVTVQKKRKTGSINGCVFPFLYLTCVDEFP